MTWWGGLVFVVQFSGGSVTFCGGLLFFSRARAREGFGDISGILAVFGGGRAAADDFAIFEKRLFFARICCRMLSSTVY